MTMCEQVKYRTQWAISSVLQVMFEYLKAPEDQRSKFPTQELHIWRLHGYRPWGMILWDLAIFGSEMGWDADDDVEGFFYTQLGSWIVAWMAQIKKLSIDCWEFRTKKIFSVGCTPQFVILTHGWSMGVLAHLPADKYCWLCGRFSPAAGIPYPGSVSGGFHSEVWRKHQLLLTTINCCKLPLPSVVQSPRHNK